jgi:hypothetical protein
MDMLWLVHSGVQWFRSMVGMSSLLMAKRPLNIMPNNVSPSSVLFPMGGVAQSSIRGH